MHVRRARAQTVYLIKIKLEMLYWYHPIVSGGEFEIDSLNRARARICYIPYEKLRVK